MIGGYYNDLLIGDGADNIFDAEKGDDTIKGGAGNDTAVYKGAFADYSIIKSGDQILITDKQVGRDGSDKLYGVETLSFKNFSVDDLDGSVPC